MAKKRTKRNLTRVKALNRAGAKKTRLFDPFTSPKPTRKVRRLVYRTLPFFYG